mgnify:FL=1
MQGLQEQRLPPLLRNCWIKLNSAFQKRLQPLGITPDQYIVLRWLYEKQSFQINQSDLAKLMFTDANNISDLTLRMEKANLIRRSISGSDKRQKVLQLTKLGESKFHESKPIAKSLESKVLAALNPSEKEDFKSLLSRLSSFLNQSD